ncbi:MAG: YjgN family protein [Granulosicoccus sp.]
MQAGSKVGKRYPFSFTGSGQEYFRIWIVNIFLTIVTLYIYSAWAKVRTKRYFYGNTVLDGTSLEYHAKPKQILLSRLVALVLLVAVTIGSTVNPAISVVATVLLFLVVPWAIWRSVKFNARMTSYRNVRFGFDGGLRPILLYQLILPVMPLIVVVGAAVLVETMDDGLTNVAALFTSLAVAITILIIPLVHKLLANYYLRNYRYGKSSFSGDLSLWRFYAIYIQALLLSLLSILLFSIVAGGIAWAMGLINVGSLKSLAFAEFEEGPSETVILSVGFAVYIFFIVASLFVAAFFRARMRTHWFQSALLDQRVSFESTATTGSLWWILFTNLLITTFTMGFGKPFAKVRMARYLADNTAVYSKEELNNFISDKQEDVSAFGDELGDAFDMDMDVGF